MDVLAPGEMITSASHRSKDGTAIMSGTSMASPHVAGLAAYLIAYEGLVGPKAVADRIKQLAVRGIVKNCPLGTTNAIAYNGAGIV